MTRGERDGISGEKGEGFARTIIKDTWTIVLTGGWKWEGGGEGCGVGLGWGEKAENYLNNNKKMNKIKTLQQDLANFISFQMRKWIVCPRKLRVRCATRKSWSSQRR